MATASAVLFALAALGGITLAALHFMKKPLPMPLAIVHGLVAATGLVLLIIGVATGASATLAVTSLVLFIIAALGGFVLFSFYIRRQPLPSTLVVIHGLVAVAGFVTLLVFLVKGSA
jgi:hypothetical protein